MMISPKVAQLLFSVRIHPQGLFFARWGFLIFFVFFLAHMKGLAFLSALVTCGLVSFFRDPNRISCSILEACLSPADGIIMEISKESPPEELDLSQGEWQKIGIFLAPWHVHINRIPLEGTIEKKVYKKGSFSHVATEGTRIHNERLSLIISLPSGEQAACVQIAGFLARRILCSVDKGDQVSTGDRYGLICFGSRVDVYLPSSFSILVREGQRMIGGETILALPSKMFTYKAHTAEVTDVP